MRYSINHRTALLMSCVIALLVLSCLPGCGYTTQSVYPQNIHTVSLPIFQNRSFYRNVEFDLTEALAKEIELRTPYKVIGQGGGQTVLQGTIVSVDQAMLSRTHEGGLPQELEFRVTVDVEWKDLQTGKTLMQRKGLSAVGRYLPPRDVGETLQVGQHEAVKKLAEVIVSTMRGDW